MLSPCHRARFRFEFINVDAVIIYLSGACSIFTRRCLSKFMIAFANVFFSVAANKRCICGGTRRALFCLPRMTLN